MNLNHEHLEKLQEQTSREFIKELLNLFLVEVPKQLANLHHSLDRRQWQDFERNAHTLKSSFGNLGLQAAREASQKLEQRARMGQLDEIDEDVHALDEIASSSIAELKYFCEKKRWI